MLAEGFFILTVDDSRKIAHFCNWKNRLDLNKYITESAKEAIVVLMTMNQFKKESELAKYLRDKYMFNIHDHYFKVLKWIGNLATLNKQSIKEEI